MKRLISIFLFLLTFQGFAQDYKRTFNWYFGSGAGINFNTTHPTALTNSAMYAFEGCATISDSLGSLLFYTNGETVWNRNHQVMFNGTGLLGAGTSIQSSIIIPQPGNDSLYYIFTTEGGWIFGLQAHLVNVKAEGGLGAVVLKNVQLVAPVCEALVATKHQNGRDIWVVSKSYPGNLFYAYLVTDKGLVSCPVTTTIGVNYNSSSIGDLTALKFSADGNKLANAIYHFDKPSIELIDFDKASGRLSNPINIPATKDPLITNQTYAMEFSSNNRYLYYSNWFNYLCRYDLSLGNGDSIAAHRDTLYKPPGGDWFLGRPRGIQLTPQNKILVAVDDSFYLSSIESPDSINCGYIERSFDLTTKRSKNGLPNFIGSYFYKPRLDFGYKRDCGSDTVWLNGTDTLNRNNWNWRFKRLADNSTQTASIQNPVHRFSDTGSYEIRLIVGADTVTKQLHIGMSMTLDLGSDTMLCGQDSIVLNAGSGYHCYRWQDSSKADTYSAKQTGTYWVMVTDKDFCQVQDSIHITFNAVPAKPSLFRSGDTLFAPQGNFTYQWFKDSQPINGVDYYTVRSTDGSYQVKITNALGCSIFSDPYNTTGIAMLASPELLTYPNPVNNVLSIELEPGSETIRQVTLLNCLGQAVHGRYYRGINPKIEISCLGFSKGLYLLELSTTSKTYTRKIIIE